jgi:thiol-disulfide isomerase/thioredoxin
MKHCVLRNAQDLQTFKQSDFDKKPVIVFIYMEGCPHCDVMKPEWEKFKHKSTVPSLEINSSLITMLDSKQPYLKNVMQNVHSFPDLKYYNNKNMGNAYNGERSNEAFLKFVKDNLKKEADEKKSVKSVKSVKKDADKKKKEKSVKEESDKKKKEADKKKKEADKKKKEADKKKKEADKKKKEADKKKK